VPEAERSAARRFPETRWSRIARLGDEGDPERLEILNLLLSRYWKPVYYYCRTLRRLCPSEAEDLTQDFFAMVLSRVNFAALTPERGSFRGFLKTALRRFVISADRSRAARHRRERGAPFPFAEAESGWHPPDAASPEEAFDRAWARAVVDEMLEELRGELLAEGKDLHYEVFRAYCLDPADGVSYRSLAEAHGLKEEDVRNHLRLVRRRGREILRRLASDYLLPGQDVEAEVRFLLQS
jgi:RNA polymerase sigma factor (sigma-70 family)